MIDKALLFTNSILDQFIRNRYAIDESKVVLNTVVDSAGNVPAENQNKIVISLINIEKETLRAFTQRNQRTESGNFASVNPSERYNLDVLVSSNFEEYSESLKFLNAIILYFQTHPSLDASVSSLIPVGINKLEFEIEKITYHQMQSLWTAMGAKYQPSVIYKIRLVTIQANEISGVVPAISGSSSNVIA